MGVPPQNGEESKNQILCDYLRDRYLLTVVDTKHWKKDPFVLFKVFYHSTLKGYDSILLSASSASIHTWLRLMRPFRRRLGRTVYIVIGGYLHIGIAEGRYRADTYDPLASIVVEGVSMLRELKSQGVKTPITVMPNFKELKRTWGDPSRFDKGPVRFIFLSRVSESKGIPLIFEALRDPRLQSRRDEFEVDFYGPVEKGYEQRFYSDIMGEPNANYHGYLDIYNDTDRSYQTVASYHVMLFPTTWMGEGFPGVILDALACGVPVIASDWNMNREVVIEGRTGRIIPPNDSMSLAEMILDVLDNRQEWKAMSMYSHRDSQKFYAGRVLDEHLPAILDCTTREG
jgi:glycosyltransferase involved in cell wall biosynthesis